MFICKDELAVTFRDQNLIELKKDLLKIHIDQFLTNHIIRIIRQHHSEFPVAKIQLRDDDGIFESWRAKLINRVIENGIDNLLSGVITSDLSEIQQYHIEDDELSSVTHISKWNRSFIQLILNYTNNLWLYRCKILHSQNNLQRDTLIRNKAISLLQKLRRDPFQLPHASRDIAHRSRSKMLTADLSSIRNWIARVSVALDLQAKNVKLGISDIRDYLIMKSTLTSDDTEGGDGYYVPGCTVDYDSDVTLDFFEKYPDERTDADTWDCDRIICSHFSLRDRFPCLTCFKNFPYLTLAQHKEQEGLSFPTTLY